MRSRTMPRLPADPRRAQRLLAASALVLLVAQALLVAPVVQAGAVYPNPPNATPSAWPSSFTSYTTNTGAPISDVEGESGVGSIFDISSAGGGSTSVFLALSGGNAFFRVRVGSDPTDSSKGGFNNATWLVLIATEDSPGVWTTKAVTGVDGKPVGSLAAPDTVYVGNAPGTGITDVYEFNTVAPAFDPTNAVGTGARVVAASPTQYFIDWQVPVSTLVTASGGAVTASTPVRLFFGSSAAANLATINKDYMTGGAVSFANLGTVTLSPPNLALTESKSLVSGPNPPQSGSTSTYDITVTAHNTGGSSLLAPSISVVIPAGTTLVSQSSATGTIGAVGSTVTWTPGTMLGGGATISATIRVSVTPTGADVGSMLTLANAASGSGSDGVGTITGTGAVAQTAGPVADAPHATSTAVSCPAGPIAYGASVSCTVTVTDTTGAGATVPTGSVAMAGTLGSSTACSLAAATSSSAACSVTFTATGVGSASLGAAYPGDASHVSSSGSSATITTTTRTLTVTTDPASKVYGAANPAFSVGYSGFVLGDTAAALGGSLAFSTTAGTSSPVGTYAVTPSGLTSANYAFTYAPANLTIGPASLTITADDASRAFGDPNPTLTATYTGFVNGDDPSDLTSPASIATAANAASPAGTYPITVSGATSTNYTISFAAGTLTVGTAALTITADDVARIYGDPNPAFTISVSGFRNGDTMGDLGGALTCSSPAGSASDVGTYPITCSGLTSADYAITFGAGTLTVGPATIDVQPDAQGRAYGAANPALTVSFSGFVNGDSASVISGAAACSTAATPTSVPGTYPITCGIGTLSATNYTFAISGSASLTVTTAALTIAVDPATKVYGSANPAFSVTPTGLQNGETLADLGGSLSFTTLAGPTSGVGSYVVSSSGLSSPNYTITFDDGTLDITKATLVVTPIDAAINPGDPIPSSFATIFSGFVAGDDASVVSGAPSCSTDATTGDPAGTYTITCTLGSLAAPNYDIVIGGTAVFTIGTVTLHVTVDDVATTYGDPNPVFTVSFTGFVNGDTAADLGGSLVFVTAATTGSDAGTYPVSVSGLTSANYVFDYVDGTLTVDPASQSITFDPLGSATYGDPSFDLSATSTSGFAVTFTSSGPCSVAGVTVTISGAGSCVITAHQAGDANHDAAPDVPQTLSIAKASPILTWATPADITFGTALGGTQLDASASVAGSYLYSPAAGTVLTAGVHTLNVTFSPTDSANYASVGGTVDITVLPVVVVVLSTQTITFDPLPVATEGDGPITLAATASSGLPVTYTVSGPCSIAGAILTLTGVGTCSVTAHQDGDASWSPAAPVTVSFAIVADPGAGVASDPTIETDKDVVSPGGHVVVTATGFEPGSDVTVSLGPDGSPVTVTADGDGTIHVTLHIPADQDEGTLAIEAVGLDPNGEVLSLTASISVLALPETATADRADPTRELPGAGLSLIIGGLATLLAAAYVGRRPGVSSRRRPAAGG
jgi:hypothetical protein